jgi:hypothetical protein
LTISFFSVADTLFFGWSPSFRGRVTIITRLRHNRYAAASQSFRGRVTMTLRLNGDTAQWPINNN